MKRLIDYDVLVNDVFYRSEHVLDYITRHKNMSGLDRKAISNTILEALVDSGVMDPRKQSLDLEEMAIVDDLEHVTYDYQPTVTSIPLAVKEKMRQKCLKITGGVPISYFYAKPAGDIHYCIYDMNTALSAVFDDFTFVSCSYNSPTREGVRTEVRPFLEINYHDEEYYVDALTKRMFKKGWFDRTYNLKEEERISKTGFSSFQQSIYDEQISCSDDYYVLIDFLEPLIDTLRENSKSAEFIYEFDKSKEYFPIKFEKARCLSEERKRFMKKKRRI